jgi:hypothetical protein
MLVPTSPRISGKRCSVQTMINSGDAETRNELERIRRVADQLCTAHASMRDRFRRRAFGLDLTVLLLSAWLTALAFVDPRFHQWLVPLQIDAQLWIGLIGVLTFCLTLIQLQMDWRRRSEAHGRSFSMYSEVKREAGYLLASSEVIAVREFQRVAVRYDMASDVGTGIPEHDFLRLKRRRKLKVKISKLLDTRPGASIALTKLQLILRDNSPWRRP